MVYITVKQGPRYHQLTLEEFLFGTGNVVVYDNTTENTKTYKRENNEIPQKLRELYDVNALVQKLRDFNEKTEDIRGVSDRHDLYRSFHIPKRSGHGLRQIDAPNDRLMGALRELKGIFENDFSALYHTSAFAYIRHRSTIKCVERHQKNESRWFGKFDLSNFFGSTTMEFVLQQFGMIYPFSEVLAREDGRAEFTKAIELAFLNGGLPQGTPISPLITNVMMIPIDFELANTFRDFGNQKFIYTRYADDFLVSSKYDFKIGEVQQEIIDVLSKFNAPFSLNREKTRYGSSSGRNFNLGIMLNKDNQMTIGSQKKRQFQAMLSNFVQDSVHNNMWDLNDVQVLEGLRNYYTMIEGEAIDNIVAKLGAKYGVNIRSMIKEQLKGGI